MLTKLPKLKTVFYVLLFSPVFVNWGFPSNSSSISPPVVGVFTNNSPGLEVKNNFVPNLMPFEDKLYFVYELDLSNSTSTPLEITGLDILDGSTGAVIRSYCGGQIEMRYADKDNGRTTETTIGNDIKGVLFIWLEFPSEGYIPKSLKHNITCKDPQSSYTVLGPEISVPSGAPYVIGSPFKGGIWVAAGGPAHNSLHRTAVLPVPGPVFLAQRFAIDWISVNDKGKAFDGDGSKNTDWFCYGEDILAVADGTVTETASDVPENVPASDPVIVINKDNLTGNHVVLQIGEGLFVLYAHMIPNSIKVKPGDRVKKGGVLGKLGNSGNSGAPHLHLHITNGSAAVLSEGIAYVFDSFQALGKNFSADPLLSGGDVFNKNVFLKDESNRINELPLQYYIIKF